MSPPLTFADALVQLKLMTSQTANFTFTDDELTQALQVAWNDSYVCSVVWDTSLTYSVGTWQYAIPSTLTTVRDIYFLPDSTQAPEKLDSSLYEVVAGNIQFWNSAARWLTSNYAIHVKGLYKLTTTDDLPTDALVNYTLSNAAYILLKQLIYKRNFVFLRNDTSMADVINARRDMQADMLRYKQALLREFESA